jgi:hypothetical protein
MERWTQSGSGRDTPQCERMGRCFSSVGCLSCRLWFLLCRLEQQVLIVEAEVSPWRHSSSESLRMSREQDELEVDAD